MKGVEFDKACFWVRVYDLLLGCLNMRVASDIASAAGEVINSGVGSDDYKGNNFMWVRVQVDITEPLTRGRKIGLSNGEES